MADTFMKHDTTDTARLMKRLREGTITPSQLTLLREIMAQTDDDDALMAAIEESAADCDAPTDADTARLKRHIDLTLRAIGESRRRPSTAADHDHDHAAPRPRIAAIRRVLTTAAAVMLPCLICAVAYLWISAHDGDNGMIAMSTKPLDKAEISLPDGSSVNLRGNSSLSFDSRFGHSASRTVNLDGQAYFKVAKDADRSFIVRTPGMDVTVHGTEFSVVSRTGSPYSEVILDSGSVTIDSPSQSVTLTPGQTATINRRDGSITVAATSTALIADWAADELTFDNIAPDSLIAEIEKAYDIRLDPSVTSRIDQRFTGTLPWDDLGLTLDVLRYVYGFDLPYHAGR